MRASTGLAERIAAAGLDRDRSEIVALQAGLAMLATLVALPLVTAAPGRLGLAILLAAPLAGYLAPELGLRRRANHRRRQIEAELPDVLDLLRVAIAAGLAPRRALQEVGRRHPGTLAEELIRLAARASLGEPVEHGPRPPRGALPVPHHPTVRRRAPARRAPRRPTRTHAARAGRRSALTTSGAPREQAAKAAPKIQLVVALLLVPAVLLLIAAAMVPATRRLDPAFLPLRPTECPTTPPKAQIRVQIARLQRVLQFWAICKPSQKYPANCGLSEAASTESGALCGFCVAEWDEVGYFESAKPFPDGGAPPTPPPGID